MNYTYFYQKWAMLTNDGACGNAVIIPDEAYDNLDEFFMEGKVFPCILWEGSVFECKFYEFMGPKDTMPKVISA